MEYAHGDIAIQAENLAKRYQIGSARTRYDTLRDQLAQGWQRLRERGAGRGPGAETIWALQDVSFSVGRGEVVAIIGRNGAGKSTLLKILARITRPTHGQALIRGRVGSLLEVGTGFHPELTGEENIYLNGAILGMRRQEIRRQFDAIVAFAEIEPFITTPVKRYSSGMYLRLAFAVAAHLEPEVLLVDEVLAVGDAAFQRKCLGKMGEVAREGRTVLFVSHNMTAVQQLCGRALLLRAGRIQMQGATTPVMAEYLSEATPTDDGDFDLAAHPARPAHYTPIIRRLTLCSSQGAPTTQYYPDEPWVAELTIAPPRLIREPRIALAIEDSLGRRITTLASYFQERSLPDLAGPCRVRCTIPRLGLGAGRYLVSASVHSQYDGLLDGLENIAWFEVGWRNNYGNGEPYQPFYGPVLTPSSWEWIES